MARSLSLTLPRTFFVAAPAAAVLPLRSSTEVGTTPLARSWATAASRSSASTSPDTAPAVDRPRYANTSMRLSYGVTRMMHIPAPLAGEPSLRDRNAKDLVQRRGSVEHLQESRLAERLHPLRLRHGPQLGGGAVFEDKV